jgi:type IV pilus assembly protein PilP
MTMQAPRIAALLAIGLALTGCSADMEELQAWMNAERTNARASVPPLLPPKKFLPQPYEAMAGVDPFSAQKLSVAVKQEASQPNSLLAAELNRRREPLEAFPLDSMSMVGSLTRQDRRYALIKVDNLLYQVKTGDYLGQNFGLVKQISETAVTLRELVQDATGDQVERITTLQLQEKGR